MATWPSHFPLQCPPSNARQDEVEVFRLVESDPPSASDFLSNIDEQPQRKFPPNLLCNACGVSVYQKYADVAATRRKYPAALGHKKVAIGTISRTDGVVLETFTPSHMTWWVQTSTPHAEFTRYNEDESSK